LARKEKLLKSVTEEEWLVAAMSTDDEQKAILLANEAARKRTSCAGDIRIAGIEFTSDAAENIEETGIDADEIQRDVRSICNGDSSEYDLLGRCLDGADPDRVPGWRDYVSAIVAAAAVENESGTRT